MFWVGKHKKVKGSRIACDSFDCSLQYSLYNIQLLSRRDFLHSLPSSASCSSSSSSSSIMLLVLLFANFAFVRHLCLSQRNSLSVQPSPDSPPFLKCEKSIKRSAVLGWNLDIPKWCCIRAGVQLENIWRRRVCWAEQIYRDEWIRQSAERPTRRVDSHWRHIVLHHRTLVTGTTEDLEPFSLSASHGSLSAQSCTPLDLSSNSLPSRIAMIAAISPFTP